MKMTLKKIGLILMAILIFASVAGCGGNSAPEKTEPAIERDEDQTGGSRRGEPEETEAPIRTEAPTSAVTPAATPTAAPATETAETRRVGEEGYGYIDIPASWVVFTDVDGSATVKQWAADPVTIISLDIVPNTDGALDPEQAAQNIAAHLESTGASDLTGARVTVGGFDAAQIYCVYPDEGIFLVIWLFDGGDGIIHYIAAEGTGDTVMEAFTIVEETYSLAE